MASSANDRGLVGAAHRAAISLGGTAQWLDQGDCGYNWPDVVPPTRFHDSVASSGTDLPTLRCLLVTCALDVGGLDELVAFLARRLPAHGVRTAVLHATSSPSADGKPKGRLGAHASVARHRGSRG